MSANISVKPSSLVVINNLIAGTSIKSYFSLLSFYFIIFHFISVPFISILTCCCALFGFFQSCIVTKDDDGSGDWLGGLFPGNPKRGQKGDKGETGPQGIQVYKANHSSLMESQEFPTAHFTFDLK